MAGLAALDELLANLGSRVARGGAERASRGEPTCLELGWPELDAALPDGGFPRGVVELSSPRALGGGTSVALTAIRAAHAKDARAWCAWLDPEGSLYAPGVALAGVDLARLLVVRPPRRDLGRIAVKVASARAFDVIVLDMDVGPGLEEAGAERGRESDARSPKAGPPGPPRKRGWPSEVLVRKLSLLAEEGGATIVLLTDSLARRSVPWPVSLRVELGRFSPEALSLRVAKDRRGRIGLAKTVPLKTRPGLFPHATLASTSSR